MLGQQVVGRFGECLSSGLVGASRGARGSVNVQDSRGMPAKKSGSMTPVPPPPPAKLALSVLCLLVLLHFLCYLPIDTAVTLGCMVLFLIFVGRAKDLGL